MVTIETGKLARQADGAVTVRLDNCIILATVVANKEPKEGQSFLSCKGWNWNGHCVLCFPSHPAGVVPVEKFRCDTPPSRSSNGPVSSS